jgi:hypothetical protein
MAKGIINNTTKPVGGGVSPTRNDDFIFLPNAKHREINGNIYLANDDHTFITPTRELLHAMVHHQESGDFPTVTEITGPVRFRHSAAPGGMVPIKNKPNR